MRILIIEDDKSLQKLLQKRLNEEKFVVDACFDGEEGLEYALQIDYDCILLDLMIPKMDGITVLKKLRTMGNHSYIFIITAKDSLEDRLEGLNTGADDYLIKPFFMDELVARLRVLFRRQGESNTQILVLGDLKLNEVTHAVTRADKEIELTSKEYTLLEYLLRNKGVVLTRTQISEHVWDADFYMESNIIDVYIRYLRNKIDRGYESKYIHTVRGYGYVLKEEK